MQPHQQRVVSERDELSEKLGKLNSFIGCDVFTGLNINERVRLAKQKLVMQKYLDILNERIAAF